MPLEPCPADAPESFRILFEELNRVSAVLGKLPQTRNGTDGSETSGEDPSHLVIESFRPTWAEPTYRAALMKNMRTRSDQFTEFIRLLISDTARLTDTMLRDLTQIHGIELGMADTEAWEAQPSQYRQDRESALRILELHTPGAIYLAGAALEMLKAFVGEAKDAFSAPDIAAQLAMMLNRVLEPLAGPSCQNLSVRHPDKYRWDPKAMLGDVINFYLLLSEEDAFGQAMAADREGCQTDLFDRACHIVRRRSIWSDTEVEKLVAFLKGRAEDED